MTALLLFLAPGPRPASAAAEGGGDAAAPAGAEAVLGAVLDLRATMVPDARTAETLGNERRGTGILLDGSGLVLTIGYVVLEAGEIELRTRSGKTSPAELVGYDHESGFGLVRALLPLEGAKPVRLGKAAGLEIGSPLFVLSHTGELAGQPVQLVDRRTFAGYWEYLLDAALFTSPPHPHFAGAALLDGDGRLVGVGSLFVGDAAGLGVPSPGNMFVPIDALPPILADLLAQGRREAPPKPWLGLSLAEGPDGRLVVVRVAADAPAAKAGLREGDRVQALAGEGVTGLADFWRRLWALGPAGVRVPLRVVRDGAPLEFVPVSIDRHRWLRIGGSL